MTTEPRPVPLDLATLRRHYLPPEPTESTVVTIRVAIARVDAVTSAVRGELDRLDVVDRATAIALVDAALDADAALDVLVAKLDRSDRPAIMHRLEQLQSARHLLLHRLTVAERDDPVVAEWRERCDQITNEWRISGSAETVEGRLHALVGFAATHGDDTQRPR